MLKLLLLLLLAAVPELQAYSTLLVRTSTLCVKWSALIADAAGRGSHESISERPGHRMLRYGTVR